MKTVFISLCAFIICQFSSQLYAKTYSCGITGVIVKSSSPCKIPKTDISLSPIKADKIDMETLNKTMSIYRVATKKRDIRALERLIAKGFIFESYKGSWDGKLLFRADKAGFIQLSRTVLLGMTRLQQIINRFSVRRVQGFLIAETLSTDKVYMGEEKFEARVLERVLLTVEDGVAKIQAIKQIEY